MINRLLTPAEVAEYLGVTPETLAVWWCTHRYVLPYTKIGTRVRYRIQDG
jgi:hypothetical protein